MQHIDDALQYGQHDKKVQKVNTIGRITEEGSDATAQEGGDSRNGAIQCGYSWQAMAVCQDGKAGEAQQSNDRSDAMACHASYRHQA